MIILKIFFIPLGIFMVIRIILGLILSNIHQIKLLNKHAPDNSNNDRISVVIPAYNEEVCIYNCVISALKSSYQNKQVIVVDDGSTDSTPYVLNKIKNKYKEYISNDTLAIIRQKNQGKARAINNAIKNISNGNLIMVLDSDSYLKSDTLEKAVAHFQNPKLIALASNVKIKNTNNFIEKVQKIEYLLGHRLKGSEQMLGIQYIIGGIGSVFRKSAMEAVGLYDYDSITEDIDFTMKLIQHFGNKEYTFDYGEDVIAYTPPVKNFPQLLKQRYRWKYGRFKALFKYKNLLFNNDKKYKHNLTFFKLPKVFFEEFLMFIDPFCQILVFYLIYKYFDFSTFISIFTLYTIYALSTFMAEDTDTISEKIVLIILSPIAYVMLFTINIIDYISLIKCLINYKEIIHNSKTTSKWEHVDR